MQPGHPFTIDSANDGLTVAALLRKLLAGQSWNQVRRIVETRRVRVNNELCLDPARRLHVGESFELLERPWQLSGRSKTSSCGTSTSIWSSSRSRRASTQSGIPPNDCGTNGARRVSPTLEDLIPPILVRIEGRRQKGPPPRLRVVHRLDKETSGLVVFARTVTAERGLGKQFHAHTVTRRYQALVPGEVGPQRVESRLIRDRGDGRRGSTLSEDENEGKVAITHFDVVEHLPGFTLLDCRLETGRTHQIRIHLAELGHPICGEKVYLHQLDGSVWRDSSGAPRLALHAIELGFRHPGTEEEMHWTMPLPPDLQTFLEMLRRRNGGGTR